MKKVVSILLIPLMLLFGTLDSFCLSKEKTGLLADLKLLEQWETPLHMKSLEEYASILEYQHLESIRVRELANGFMRSPETEKLQVKSHDILYMLGFERSIVDEGSLLFKDTVFDDYYKLRTSKVQNEYEKTGKLDLAAFKAKGRSEFDIYIKGAGKEAGRLERFNLLLQDELLYGVMAENIKDKKGHLERVLALSSAANADNRLQCMYELMESRVRLKLIEQLIDIDRNKMAAVLDKTMVKLEPEKNGMLTFKYLSDFANKTIQEYSINMRQDDPNSELVLPLGILVRIYGRATFTGADGTMRVITRSSLWDSISYDAAEGLEAELVKAYIDEKDIPGYDVLSGILENYSEQKVYDPVEIRGRLLKESAELQKLAGEITGSLNSMDNYLKLKAKGIENSYTIGFLRNKAAWRAKLNNNLKSMNKLYLGIAQEDSGAAGYLSYIRSYVDYSRECRLAGMPEDKLIYSFRERVLQFRKMDEGALWVIDMLYKMKYTNL